MFGSKFSPELYYPSFLTVFNDIWWVPPTNRLRKTDRRDFWNFASFSRYFDFFDGRGVPKNMMKSHWVYLSFTIGLWIWGCFGENFRQNRAKSEPRERCGGSRRSRDASGGCSDRYGHVGNVYARLRRLQSKTKTAKQYFVIGKKVFQKISRILKKKISMKFPIFFSMIFFPDKIWNCRFVQNFDFFSGFFFKYFFWKTFSRWKNKNFHPDFFLPLGMCL